MPAKCARGGERRYTWQGRRESLFVFSHCSLLLFKSEDEQVPSYNGWFWNKSGQISRDVHARRGTCTHTFMHTKSTPLSIHYFYSILFWASFIYEIVSFASISFALCLQLVLSLMYWVHFKTHKATVVASVAPPPPASTPLSLKSCFYTITGSRRVKVVNKTFFILPKFLRDVPKLNKIRQWKSGIIMLWVAVFCLCRNCSLID